MFLKQSDCQACEPIEIRLLDIDAPEYSQDPWGKRVKNYVYTQLNRAEKIELEYKKDKLDKYGRHLVYLHYKVADKTFLLNEMLLNRGFAVLFTFDKFSKYLKRLKAAEALAQEKKFNIWRERDGIKMTPYEFRKRARRHSGENRPVAKVKLERNQV